MEGLHTFETLNMQITQLRFQKILTEIPAKINFEFPEKNVF